MQNPVITVMVKAARQAGTVILRHMNKLDSLNVFEKTKQDYASEVDSLAEAEIIKELNVPTRRRLSCARNPARWAKANRPS